jgi:hypothetical protein
VALLQLMVKMKMHVSLPLMRLEKVVEGMGRGVHKLELLELAAVVRRRILFLLTKFIGHYVPIHLKV